MIEINIPTRLGYFIFLAELRQYWSFGAPLSKDPTEIVLDRLAYYSKLNRRTQS